MSLKKIIKKLIYRIRGEYTTEDLVKMGLTVGEKFNPQFSVHLDPSHCWLITIGDRVTIAPRAQILAHDASTCGVVGYAKIGRVDIGNDVFIGAGAIVLPNVKIGDNVIVGAGAVVANSLEANGVYAGNPAKRICSIEEFKEKHVQTIKTRPCYGEEYTLRKGVSKEKKKEQREALLSGMGYVK